MESPYEEGLTLADRLANVESVAQIVAFGREPHTHIRMSLPELAQQQRDDGPAGPG